MNRIGGDIEAAVLEHVKNFLATPTFINQLAQSLDMPGGKVAELLSRLNPLWDTMFPAERNRLMYLLLKRVALHENRLDFGFSHRRNRTHFRGGGL